MTPPMPRLPIEEEESMRRAGAAAPVEEGGRFRLDSIFEVWLEFVVEDVVVRKKKKKKDDDV